MISAIYSSAILSALMFLLFFAGMLMLSSLLQNFRIVADGTTKVTGRYGALDGLRGVLAYGVMVHHVVTAYIFFKTGVWKYSDNSVLNQMGKTTVALFFMITGFLFAEKCTARLVDWKSLYISRVARLVPLYSLLVVVVFLAVFALSGFSLRVSSFDFFVQFLKWLAFVCFGRPDINGMEYSWTLIAGVNWSLKFEWAFYIFGLPLLYVVSRFLDRAALLVLSLFFLFSLLVVLGLKGGGEGSFLYLLHFMCGITSAFLYSNSLGRRFISKRVFHFLGLVSIFAVGFFVDSGSSIVVLASMLFFLSVLGGFSFFGALESKSAIWLGDISYGIYLIHGLVVWLFYFAFKYVGWLDWLDHSMAFLVILPVMGGVVLLLSSGSYLYIERPIIEVGRRLGRRV